MRALLKQVLGFPSPGRWFFRQVTFLFCFCRLCHVCNDNVRWFRIWLKIAALYVSVALIFFNLDLENSVRPVSRKLSLWNLQPFIIWIVQTKYSDNWRIHPLWSVLSFLWRELCRTRKGHRSSSFFSQIGKFVYHIISINQSIFLHLSSSSLMGVAKMAEGLLSHHSHAVPKVN